MRESACLNPNAPDRAQFQSAPTQTNANLAALAWAHGMSWATSDPMPLAPHNGLRAMVTTECVGALKDKSAADPAPGKAMPIDASPDVRHMGHSVAVLARNGPKWIAPWHVG